MFTLISKLIVKTFYKEVAVKGIENLPDSGPAIFTPNHPNALIDPLLLFYLPPAFRIRFVAKAPLFKIPLLGFLMRKMRAIPVVRRFEADGQIDYKTFFSACVNALAKGDSICIFPEGVSLPQPYLAPLKTGVSRLFFLAHETGANVPIIPIGLNYEDGAIFRTSVLVNIAKPLKTDDLFEKYMISPDESVKDLTAKINKVLAEHVFQSENFRDRELMLLLEKIYRDGEIFDSWSERLERLKKFENGLKVLRNRNVREIDILRRLLIKYEKSQQTLENLQAGYGVESDSQLKRFIMFLLGFPLALLGRLLTVVPYQSVNLVVKYIKMYDESQAATHKVTYALLFYPITFIIETVVVYLWLGWIASLFFAVAVVPTSYFSLYFFEWLQKGGIGIKIPVGRLKKRLLKHYSSQIDRERYLIVEQVDKLAAMDALKSDA